MLAPFSEERLSLFLLLPVLIFLLAGTSQGFGEESLPSPSSLWRKETPFFQRLFASNPATFSLREGIEREEVDFLDFSIPLMRTDDPRYFSRAYKIVYSPRLLLVGMRGIRIRVDIEGDYRFVDGDRFFIQGQNGAGDLPLEDVHVVGRDVLVGTVPEVPRTAIGYHRLILDQTARGGGQSRFDYAFKVVPSFRVLLTFDDGPAKSGDPNDGMVEGSSTLKVLNTLRDYRHGPGRRQQGLTAVFFVLTQPETFYKTVYPKGECRDGEVLLREIARRGHIIGAHWGGRYFCQTIGHNRRVKDPPYDWNGNGDASDDGANALESDLLECIHRIESVTGIRTRFVRPARWMYQDPNDPVIEFEVLETYERLGLKMILTDAKLGDGGYWFVGHFVPKKKVLREGILRAVSLGVHDLIITMHDSNDETALQLPFFLDWIKKTIAEIELGGERIDPERHFQFVSDPETALAILQERERFAHESQFKPDLRTRRRWRSLFMKR